MRSQACAQVISGWRRRRPSLKRRSTAPLAIGVTPGSSAASSSERARCRGGAGEVSREGRTVSQSVSHYHTPTNGAHGPLYTLGLK